MGWGKFFVCLFIPLCHVGVRKRKKPPIIFNFKVKVWVLIVFFFRPFFIEVRSDAIDIVVYNII